MPYRFLHPAALFFVRIGVFAARNEVFGVGATLLSGAFGCLLLQLQFEPAPILLGFVLGPRLEKNFRRSVLLSRGSLQTFVDRPISAAFVALSILLILGQAIRRAAPGQPSRMRVRVPMQASGLLPQRTPSGMSFTSMVKGTAVTGPDPVRTTRARSWSKKSAPHAGPAVASSSVVQTDGVDHPAAGFALSAKCGLVAAAALGPAAGTAAVRRDIQALLGAPDVMSWIRSKLGKA